MNFLPASAIAAAGFLLATGRVFDLLTTIGAIALVFIVASVLDLMFRSILRVLSGPQVVASSLATGMVHAAAKHIKLSEARSNKLRIVFLGKFQPLVAAQFNDFWALRTTDEKFDEELRRREVVVVSLGFLAAVYAFYALVSFSILPRASYLYYNSIPSELWVFFGLFLLDVGFIFAFTSEVRAYRRALWDKIPLLAISTNEPDSDFWEKRRNLASQKKIELGEKLANSIIEDADRKLEFARRAEFDREFLETRVAEEAGEDPAVVRVLLEAVASANRDSTNRPFVFSFAFRVAAVILPAALAVTSLTVNESGTFIIVLSLVTLLLIVVGTLLGLHVERRRLLNRLLEGLDEEMKGKFQEKIPKETAEPLFKHMKVLKK